MKETQWAIVFLLLVSVCLAQLQCNQPGRCLVSGNDAGKDEGNFLSTSLSENWYQCLEQCSVTSSCKWCNFDKANHVCILLKSCDSIEQDSESCMFGEKDCKQEDPEMTQLMVVGGWDPRDLLKDVQVFDLSSQTPRPCFQPADFPSESCGHVGAFLDGSPIVCGGVASNGCWRYLKHSDEWTYFDDNETSGSAAALLDKDTLLVAGGYSYLSDSEVPDTYLLSPGQATLTTRYLDMPYPASYHNLLKINSTHLFLVNGNPTTDTNSYIHELGSSEWTPFKPIPRPTYGAAAGVVVTPEGEKEIVCTGGGHVTGLGTQIYSLVDDTWRDGQDLVFGDITFAASVPFGDTFLVVGGSSSDEICMDTIYLYDVGQEQWVILQQRLASPRDEVTAFLVPAGYFEC